MATETSHAVVLENLTKTFGSVVAVREVSLTVHPGELLAILGPSGCGKTTTLRMIAGFEIPTSGRVLINGRDITNVPAHRRNIGMVFQNYALFPHMDVFENVAFGLRERHVLKSEIPERVHRILELVRLTGFEKRRPSQLSGGEQQRVSLARALVIEPALLLMDEPLGALDRKLREEMQFELKEMLQRVRVTSMFVTHDQEEALAMADRVAVMYRGRLEQVDTPSRIYENPSTVFTAGFLGLSNIFQGQIEAGGDRARLTTETGLQLISPLPDRDLGSELSLMIRPEKVLLSNPEKATDGVNCYKARITGLRYLGATIEYVVELVTGERIVARQQQSQATMAEPSPGSEVTVCLPVASLRWLSRNGPA